MRRSWVAPAVALLLSWGQPVMAQQGVRLTVEGAVERALQEGLEIAEAEAQLDAAKASRSAARALYGPRVMVDAKAFYFNRRPTFELDLGTSDDIPMWLDQAMGQLLPDGPMDAGEQYSVDFRVSVVQPLTKLEAIRELDEIRGLDVEIAEVGAAKAASELAYQVRAASYDLLNVRDTIDMLEETVEEVEARETQVKAFRTAELVGPEQVLEVSVRLAEVRQQLIKVRALEPVAESRLRTLVRLDPGTTIEVVEPTLPGAPPTLEESLTAAAERRGEIAEVRLRAKQAETGVRAKMQEYVPDISLVATYQYQAGTSFGQPELAVGAVMSWTPFAWGQTWHSVRAAKATARRARLAEERVEQLIGLDVEQAFARMEAAREQITVAETAAGLAEELYRIERARFEVRDNTATDLLAAQTSLLRAQSSLRSARYDYLRTIAALRRASGQP